MIARRTPTEPKKRPPREPLDVRLTVRFNFGSEPGDSVTVLDHQRIPMVNSVFEQRDRILRGFAGLLIKAGLKQPNVARELFPLLRRVRERK